MNKEIELLNKKIEAQDKIINEQVLEIANLKVKNTHIEQLWKETNVIIRNEKTLAINDNAMNYILNLEQRIDKANEILSNILIIKRSDGNYGAVKNTRKKEVYEAICMLNEILETPHRINYNLLGDKENE